MTDFKIKAIKRDRSAKETRKNGMVPAVIYGKKYDNQSLELEATEFIRLYKEAGSSNLVDLEIDGNNIKTLIHDIQRDPLKNAITHADFLKIDMKEKIRTEIPLEFVGETDLVIQQEGSLLTNKDSIEVECLPADLVDHINIDISVLTSFDMNIKVSDLRVPSGIEVLDDPEEVIALVQPPRSEEELEALNEEVVEDVEAIEVENAGEAPVEGEEGESEDKKDEKKEE